MKKVNVDTERCKACGYCVRHCPKKAVGFSGHFNGNGYNYVVIDDEKCIGCGICYTTCPDQVFEVLE